MSAANETGKPADQAPPPPDPDFAQLVSEAEQLEGPAPGAPGAAPAPVAIDQAAQVHELLGVLKVARLMVGPMFSWWPEFDQVWGDQTLGGIANGGAAVMTQHGWTLGWLKDEWGPYIALGFATIPPALATHQAIKHHRAQLEAQARQAQQRPPAPAPEQPSP